MAGQFREQIVKRAGRSNGWAKVRVAKIDATPYCEACGREIKFLRRWRLQVHHIKPFHIFPELELDPDNLMCLCSSPACHLDKGHLGDFKSFNPDARADCEAWRKKIKWRPY